MNLINRFKSYNSSRQRQEKVLTRAWFIFKWEILIIILLGLAAALLNQIPNWDTKPDVNGVVDPILGYPLRDNIIYSSVSIFLTIGIAIFIGIFSEIGKFAGKYGSSIFVLVPSFVWLMSDRSDNHIEHVLNTAKLLGTIIFWSMIGLVIMFSLITIIKQIFATFALAQKTKLRIEFIYNFINRFIVVLVNILIVLMLGYGFINFGVFTLHLADNTPEVVAKTSIPYNLHSENFTVYIGIIAVAFALIMVSIGLANRFKSEAEKRVGLERDQKWETFNKENLAAAELKTKINKRLERERKES